MVGILVRRNACSLRKYWSCFSCVGVCECLQESLGSIDDFIMNVLLLLHEVATITPVLVSQTEVHEIQKFRLPGSQMKLRTSQFGPALLESCH